MRYAANHLGLESDFDVDCLDDYVRVRWTLRKLGDPFPGGDWLVKDPVLEFRAPGREPARVLLIGGGHPDRTLCGLRCYRRMREVLMPSIPFSYAVGLASDRYSLHLTGELYDCRRLVHYCDAMQIFAGWFSQMVESFEQHRRLWEERGHAEAGEPYRWPLDLPLGELAVPRDLVRAPRYYPLNELDLTPLDWAPAPVRLQVPPPAPSPLQPERYFGTQIASGIRSMRENGFCRWGTHCTDEPAPPGSCWMGGDRVYGFWGNTFTMQYMMTGDAQTGEAAWYCVRQCLELLKKEPEPHYKHCLSFGLSTMMSLRFARLVGRPDLVEPLAEVWRKWPYDAARHMMATQPTADGGDHTPNDTYNMKMVGATAMWLIGNYLQAPDLMARGRDCVMGFILPAMQPQGYWFYRPGSPEGKIVDGIQSNNHYDGFVKCLLARLLFHPEWRAEPGVLDALRRGMDFTLARLTAQDDRTLKFELHPDAKFGPRETLARYLGHTGGLAEPLGLLALYAGASYVDPIRKSVQFTYDLRDAPILSDYWDNSWLYAFYVGVLNLSRLGFRFEGTPDRLNIQPPASAPDAFL